MRIPDSEIVDAPQFVRGNCACFADELETTMIGEIGKDTIDRVLAEQKAHFDLEDRRDALKVPACMAKVLSAAAAEGKKSKTLEAIVRAIYSCA
jgi:hypothetical protein